MKKSGESDFDERVEKAVEKVSYLNIGLVLK